MELQDFLAAGSPKSTASRLLEPLRRLTVRLLMPYIIAVLHENEVLKAHLCDLDERLRQAQQLFADLSQADDRILDQVQHCIEESKACDFEVRALKLDQQALVARLRERLVATQPWGNNEP